MFVAKLVEEREERPGEGGFILSMKE